MLMAEAPPERRRTLLRVGEALAGLPVREKACRARGLTVYRLMADWRVIVGPEFAACTRPLKFSSGTLHLRVSPQGAVAVQYGRHLLLERITRSVGGALGVQRLALSQGPLPPEPAKPATRVRVDPASVEVPGISDSGLRAALQGLGAALKT